MGRLDLALWEWAGPPRMLPRPILECSPGQQEQPIVGSDTLLPPPRAGSSREAGSDRWIPYSHQRMRSSSLTLGTGGWGVGVRFSPCSSRNRAQVNTQWTPFTPQPSWGRNSLPLPPHRGETPERRQSTIYQLCKV